MYTNWAMILSFYHWLLKRKDMQFSFSITIKLIKENDQTFIFTLLLYLKSSTLNKESIDCLPLIIRVSMSGLDIGRYHAPCTEADKKTESLGFYCTLQQHKLAFKYHISRFSQILEPPPHVSKISTGLDSPPNLLM